MNWMAWLNRASSPLTQVDDVLWKTRGEAVEGLVDAAVARLRKGDSVVLVTHFPSEFGEMADQLEGKLEYVIIDRPMIGEELLRNEDAPPCVWLAPARALTTGPPAPTYDAQQSVSFLVHGRHLIRSADVALADFALTIPCRSYLRHFLSFQHELWQRAEDAEMEFLRGLGLKANEAISSRIITNRLNQIQSYTEESVVKHPVATDSAAEWLRENIAQQ